MDVQLFNYFINLQFGGKHTNKPKWKTFQHNGVLFPPPYEPHHIPIIYDGVKIILDEESEEYATIYAKFVDSEYTKNKVFNKNFFHDWKKYLHKSGAKQITDFDKCDFSLIVKYIVKKKEEANALSKEEKQKIKDKRDAYEEKYKTALVDDKEQPVGNFRIEPPGIFLGRGCHPKAGKIKERIYPEDITLNLDKKSLTPELPKFYKDRKWGKIIHDNTLEWLASWKDNITGKIKYVWLGAKSDFKAKSDQHKFDLARKLAKNIMSIRKTNDANMFSDDIKIKQLATALYLIDNFALRVGNEKGDDEADTVGVCSLRIEHINLLDDNILELDFLGKDSVRYQNKVKIEDHVYRNLLEFIKNKKKSDDLFDLISTSDLNNYVKELMPELTAKVFRTFNASYLFQSEINKINSSIDKIKDETNKINIILDLYNKANVKVALLCNHQKNVSKSFKDQLEKFDDKLKELKQIKKETDNKDKIEKINNKIKEVRAKRDLKIELKNLSLTTSKTNYIDPRISIAFLKKHNIPIEKLFSKALVEKFFWAVEIDDKWRF